MSKSRPIVIHPEEGVAGPASPGLEERHLFDRDGRWAGWAGWIHNEAGDKSGWHHHAANNTYVYVIRGTLRIDFGPGGAESVEAGTGDFIFIPSQTIHHETTSHDSPVEAFVLRVGSEPEYVKADGPEAAEG